MTQVKEVVDNRPFLNAEKIRSEIYLYMMRHPNVFGAVTINMLDNLTNQIVDAINECQIPDDSAVMRL